MEKFSPQRTDSRTLGEKVSPLSGILKRFKAQNKTTHLYSYSFTHSSQCTRQGLITLSTPPVWLRTCWHCLQIVVGKSTQRLRDYSLPWMIPSCFTSFQVPPSLTTRDGSVLVTLRLYRCNFKTHQKLNS